MVTKVKEKRMKIKMTLPIKCVSIVGLGDFHNVLLIGVKRKSLSFFEFFLESGFWNEMTRTTHLQRAKTQLHHML